MIKKKYKKKTKFIDYNTEVKYVVKIKQLFCQVHSYQGQIQDFFKGEFLEMFNEKLFL